MIVGLVFAWTASVSAEPDLLFELRFDSDGARAAKAQGRATPTRAEPMTSVRRGIGRDGGFAYRRSRGDVLRYAAKGNIRPLEGTISVWIRPENWGDGVEERFKHILAANLQLPEGRGLKLLLYKERRKPNLTFHIAGAAPRSGSWLCRANATGILLEDRWHRLDVTWHPGRMALYVDGEPAASAPLDRAFEDLARGDIQGGRIELLPLMWRPSSWSDSTLIDDVEIRARALSAAEVRREYRLDIGEGPVDTSAVAIRLGGLDLDDGRLDRIRAYVDTHGLPEAWGRAFDQRRVEVVATLMHDGAVVSESSSTPDRARFEMDLEGASQAGTYDLDLSLRNRDTGDEKALRASASRPSTEWFGSDVGSTPAVPEPWVPIEVEGNVVRVWGREYHFSGPFLSHVRSGNTSLLQQPVRLFADTGNGENEVRFSAPEMIQRRPDAVVYAGSGEAGPLVVHYRNTIWFDGYTRAHLEVGPVGTRVRRLVLRYAVVAEAARYHTTPLWRPFGRTETRYSWKHASAKAFSLLWLMGDHHGFAWIPEHEGNWVYDDDPIRLTRTPSGEARVELRLIDRPVQILDGVTYDLGFIATPTRPRPPNFRTFAIGGPQHANADAASIGWRGRGFSYYGSLIPGPDYSNYIEQLGPTGPKLFPYSSPTYLSTPEPVVTWFRESWRPPGLTVFPIEDVDGSHYDQIALTPTRAFQDFFADKVDRYLRAAGPRIGGVYLDLVAVRENRSAVAGGAFTDAFGRKIPMRLTTLALRNILMRVLRISRSHGRITWYHGHSLYNPAVQGLGDFWYPGESYDEALRADPYFYSDRLPQERFATELSSETKGVGVVLLPVLGRSDRSRIEDAALTEAMLTRMLLNDVPVAARQSHAPTIFRIWALWKRLRLDEARFVRFDRNDRVLCDTPDVAVSYYELPDGDLLAVVGNLTASPRSVALRASGSTRARDEWTGREIRDQGQGLRLELAPRRFALVRIRMP
jgi:hypothetical protein